jgi:hypothetical protein
MKTIITIEKNLFSRDSYLIQKHHRVTDEVRVRQNDIPQRLEAAKIIVNLVIW